MEKFDMSSEYLQSIPTIVDILLVGETWIKVDRSRFYSIRGYNCVHSCRPTSAGGLYVFIREEIEFEVTENPLDLGCHYVGLKLLATPKPVFIHGFYRPPDFEFGRLIARIERILASTDQTTTQFILGDMELPANINASTGVQEYLQLLAAYNMVVTITIVTRVLVAITFWIMWLLILSIPMK